MTIHANIDPIISESEAAEAGSVSTSTLRRMHKRGEGPPRIRLSPRRVGYRRRDIEEWLSSRIDRPTEERGS
jgi:predicted DNA-binding transcriptional regulator AlpA